MSQESAKTNEAQPEERTIEATDYYCYQLGTYYCKNQCPNDCYQRYQEKINKLFSVPINSEKQ
ncbi:MAG: hypothetical protein ACOXZ6_02605 [Syntrophomonadaceae bacterium]|jgi:hypothetical protein